MSVFWGVLLPITPGSDTKKIPVGYLLKFLTHPPSLKCSALSVGFGKNSPQLTSLDAQVLLAPLEFGQDFGTTKLFMHTNYLFIYSPYLVYLFTFSAHNTTVILSNTHHHHHHHHHHQHQHHFCYHAFTFFLSPFTNTYIAMNFNVGEFEAYSP